MIHKYWNIKIIISVSPHCRATLNPSRNCHWMENTCVLRTTKQVELSPTKTKYIVKHAFQQAAPIQFSWRKMPRMVPLTSQKKPLKSTVGSQWIRIISSRGIQLTFDQNMKSIYAKQVLQRIPSGILAESDDDPCKICGSLLSPDVTNTSTIPLVDKKSSTIVISNKHFYNAIRSLHALRLTSQ